MEDLKCNAYINLDKNMEEVNDSDLINKAHFKDSQELLPSHCGVNKNYNRYTNGNFKLQQEACNWTRAMYTLLPSTRVYTLRRRANRKITPATGISSSVTLPRSFQKFMEPEESLTAHLQNQLTMQRSWKVEKRDLPRRSHNSFGVAHKTTEIKVDGIGVPDHSLPVDKEGFSSINISDEEYQWEMLTAVPSFAVPMAVRREFRNNLKQAYVSPAEGFAAWELRQQKAKKKLSQTWKELTSKLNFWSYSFKRIEGYHGTGVVSYFLFLRWLMLLNLGIFVLVLFYILLPQILFNPVNNQGLMAEDENDTTISSADKHTDFKLYSSRDSSSLTLEKAVLTDKRLNMTDVCSENYTESVENSISNSVNLVLQDFLQGTGWMELTLLFFGYYKPSKLNFFGTSWAYNFPLAYLLTTVAYFIASLVLMVKYTTEGVREALMSSENQLQQYCNVVFAGWDFCIEDKKTARLKHNIVTRELKGRLAEDHRKTELSLWTYKKKMKVYTIRTLVSLSVMGLLIGCGYLLLLVSDLSLEKSGESNEGFVAVVIQLLPSLTITGFSLIVPGLLVKMAAFEEYSKAFEIKITLIRTVFLRLASIGSLVYSFYHQINCSDSTVGLCKQGINRLACKKPLCWETYIGQQLYKLVIVDFVVVVFNTFVIEVVRKLVVNHCACAKKIGVKEFDITSNVLDLVYSQTLCWLGTFYSPLLPGITVLKFIILFYIKQFAVMVIYEHSQTPYKTSRSNAFFMIVLMLSFVLCIIPLGYSIADYSTMWSPVKDMVRSWPTMLQNIIDFMTSAGFAVPCFMILCLTLYYYLAQLSAYQHMAEVLKDQLIDAGRDKQFLLLRLSDVASKQESLTTIKHP
ncbi:transmembrane channel-like protein 7 isoform X2 [Tachypleus tridentatus]|uniref:transmembrane channel-like protein 7 isoform X2 n=1 Tax=Tachypleus tridentatus TaxID=6853 RepID=UPI003FD0A277